jgi:hypothetical protein
METLMTETLDKIKPTELLRFAKQAAPRIETDPICVRLLFYFSGLFLLFGSLVFGSIIKGYIKALL